MPDRTESPPPPNRRLRAAMAAYGLDQGDLAVVLNLGQSAVSRRLTGHTPWRLPELQAIAEHLAVPVADLLDDLSPEVPRP